METPQVRTHVSEKENPTAAEPGLSRGLVLVVDDTPMNLELARWILQPKGYAVLLVQSVTDALATARRERPDLILSDLHMPEGDGFGLLAALQADPLLRDVPFAFLTAEFLGAGDEDRALAKGAKAFLQRPLSVKELLSAVEKLIGSKPDPREH